MYFTESFRIVATTVGVIPVRSKIGGVVRVRGIWSMPKWVAIVEGVRLEVVSLLIALQFVMVPGIHRRPRSSNIVPALHWQSHAKNSAEIHLRKRVQSSGCWKRPLDGQWNVMVDCKDDKHRDGHSLHSRPLPEENRNKLIVHGRFYTIDLLLNMWQA